MIPSFKDHFKSSYYSTSHVKAVDLSDKKLAKHLLSKNNPEAAATAQKLISSPDVQKVLSETLNYDMAEGVPQNNAILEKNGFKLLGSKPDMRIGKIVPFYSVIEHDELPGWIIKSGANRIPKDVFLIGPSNDRGEMAFFTENESLLRIKMANRIRKIAAKENLDVIVPQKKLVAYANVDGITEANRKYCIVCEKINILSVEDTVQTIKDMDAEHQKEIARKITTLVKKVGLVDASFHNIRLTPEGKLAFIDTEPAGLMVTKKSGLRNKLFGPKGASVEKSASIGLYALMSQATKGAQGTAVDQEDAKKVDKDLEEFYKQVKSDYNKAATPKLSKWKITISVLSLGIIPMVNVIIAFVKTILSAQKNEEIRKMDNKVNKKLTDYIFTLVPEAKGKLITDPKVLKKVQDANIAAQKEDFVKKYAKKRGKAQQQYFSYVNGVPRRNAQAA